MFGDKHEGASYVPQDEVTLSAVRASEAGRLNMIEAAQESVGVAVADLFKLCVAGIRKVTNKD